MCVFCSIANHELPTEFLYEDDRLMVFADIKPSAPVHYLVIPKEHIPSLGTMTSDRKELLGALLNQAR
ncbi:MAG: HIT domain-containing protein, partial [Patescibacteria group bacterium]